MNRKKWYSFLLCLGLLLGSFHGDIATVEAATVQPSYTQRQSQATITLRSEQEVDEVNASSSSGFSGNNHRLPTTGELTSLSLSFLGTLLLVCFYLLTKRRRKERSNES